MMLAIIKNDSLTIGLYTVYSSCMFRMKIKIRNIFVQAYSVFLLFPTQVFQSKNIKLSTQNYSFIYKDGIQETCMKSKVRQNMTT